ncbi:MAG: hypothetical protein JXQ96_07330 [Cyclobacteriaceae bacterium]
MLTRLKFYLLRLVFFLGIVAVGLMITGNLNRDYEVLEKGSSVKINGKKISQEKVALRSLPRVQVGNSIDESELENIYYEMIEEDSKIVVNYFFSWKGENHPNSILNVASKIWRLIYFRFATSDVEFIQVNINKSSGKVEEVKFKNGSNDANASLTCLLVKGWNHDFSLCKSDNSDSSQLNGKLTYFENSKYKFLKICRREQGDYKTKHNVMNFPFIIFLALLATYYFRHIQKDYNNEYEQSA